MSNDNIVITTDRFDSNMNSASAQIQKMLPTKQGGAGAEKAYGAAYQALVKAGRKPQIRRKYR